MREAAIILRTLGREPGPEARTLEIRPDELVDTMSALKSLGDFSLFDIDAVDRPEAFEVAYRLLDRGGEGPVGLLAVKLRVAKEEPRLPSIIQVWKAADVMEREVWDLMGIVFEGREGLKRILCKDDFEGHPLRKDFVVERTPRFADEVAGGAR